MAKGRPFNPALKSAFETRLVRYAVAGTALLAAAPAADASIISLTGLSVPVARAYIAFGNPITYSSNSSGPHDLAIVGGGTTVGAEMNGPGGIAPGPLAYGAPITLANTNVSTSILISRNSVKGEAYHDTGPWSSMIGLTGYFGIQFQRSGQPYLGWAQMKLDDFNSATVLALAWETNPGQTINAGQLVETAPPAPAPEPSSLALFAAGAAGVLVLRRRRKAAA